MTVATDTRKTGISAGPTLLAASAVAVSHTGNTNETALATVSIPGGAMGPNGGIEVRVTFTYTNSANNKTMRVRFGGISGTQYAVNTVTTSAMQTGTFRIRNRNSASSQVSSHANSLGSTGATTANPTTSAVDTSVAVDLVMTGQLVNTGESIAVDSYEVWLLP